MTRVRLSVVPPARARFIIEPYRTDRAAPEDLALLFLRLLALARQHRGDRALTMEVHVVRVERSAPLAWFGVVCESTLGDQVSAALRSTFSNARVRPMTSSVPSAAVRVRLVPRGGVAQARTLAGDGADVRSGEALLRAMCAAGTPVSIQVSFRPAGRLIGAWADSRREEVTLEQRRAAAAWCWSEVWVHAGDVPSARAVAAPLIGWSPLGWQPRWGRRAGARWLGGVTPRRRPWGLRDVTELSGLWQPPAPEFTALPCLRAALPTAPAPPGVTRVDDGAGVLCDEHGPLTISPALRRAHTAVVGAVEQGKTSFLVASVREDLARSDTAVIVLDPKGDAADAVLSVVADERACTLLDLAAPACGFNPLRVRASPDSIADHVVAALRGLFSDGEVKGSSDRYLRNAIIGALACNPGGDLWDVARLLEVGERGRAARATLSAALLERPQYAELAIFFDTELPAQLADARATTTAKLDAPANKLARLLNSPSVERVLRNPGPAIDIDGVIERGEVLVVRGALGEIGTGNVAVLMALLLGMLDAALARAQDRRRPEARRQVALKVDEAPLVITERFAQTLALKRSAGLETVACWQTDSQWPVELRAQLDALFAHRVLFATASVEDARTASGLLMAQFADQVRAADPVSVALAAPDVRLHLPRHTAIASWTTEGGRERPFIATTIALPYDSARVERHVERQRVRHRQAIERAAAARASSETPAVAPRQLPPELQSPPSTRPDPATIVELRALEGAGRARRLSGATPERAQPLSARDRVLLAWLHSARRALSTQIHLRFDRDRALTTTQRRLKVLADGGMIERIALHRPDGGSLPLCCSVTPLGAKRMGLAPHEHRLGIGHAALPALRRDLRLVGWLLALEQVGGEAVRVLAGPGGARIDPPVSALNAVRLDAGVQLHGLGGGMAAQPPVSLTVAADAVVRLRTPVVGEQDVLVIANPLDPADLLGRLEFLMCAWWRAIPAWSGRAQPPVAVLIAADLPSATDLIRIADERLLGALARHGDPPSVWQRPGRQGITVVIEEEIHAGRFVGWRVPPLPPTLRSAPAGLMAIEPVVALERREVANPPLPWG